MTAKKQILANDGARFGTLEFLVQRSYPVYSAIGPSQTVIQASHTAIEADLGPFYASHRPLRFRSNNRIRSSISLRSQTLLRLSFINSLIVMSCRASRFLNVDSSLTRGIGGF